MILSCAFASGHGRAVTKVGLGAGPLAGLGPVLLMNVQTYSRAPSALTETEVGYHPVGMRPAARLPTRSITATAFSNPNVTYRVFSSGLRAAEFGLEPLYLSPGRDIEIVSETAAAA